MTFRLNINLFSCLRMNIHKYIHTYYILKDNIRIEISNEEIRDIDELLDEKQNQSISKNNEVIY